MAPSARSNALLHRRRPSKPRHAPPLSPQHSCRRDWPLHQAAASREAGNAIDGGNARDDGGTGGGLAALKNLLVESDGERRSPARKGYLRQCGYATRVDDGRLHVQRARRRVQVSPRGHSLRRDPELLGESACALSVSSREAADQMGWAWARRIPPTTPARNTRSRPMSSRTSSTAG